MALLFLARVPPSPGLPLSHNNAIVHCFMVIFELSADFGRWRSYGNLMGADASCSCTEIPWVQEGLRSVE